MKIRNMEEFAAVSGVSRPTLSKYFDNPNRVRSTTRHKIEEALKKYSFRPNVYATNQNRRTTRNIGIVVPYLSDPFFSEIARVVEQSCLAAGYNPILLSSHGDLKREINNLNSLRELKSAGVLLAPFGRKSDKVAIQKFSEDIPLVLFDADVQGAGEAFIGTNICHSIALLVEYLCRSGEPPCFFEILDAPNPNANKKRETYLKVMEKLNQTPYVFQVEGSGWDFEKVGYDEGRRILLERGFPTNTVLCSNDRLAIGFLAGAYDLGIKIGRGVDCAMRVAGHDDHPFSRYTCPSLTTFALDYASIADYAVNALFDVIEMKNKNKNKNIVYCEGKLVMRDSA